MSNGKSPRPGYDTAGVLKGRVRVADITSNTYYQWSLESGSQVIAPRRLSVNS